jgi:hypothetical protein
MLHAVRKVIRNKRDLRHIHVKRVGRDRIVGVETVDGQGGPVIESRCAQNFHRPGSCTVADPGSQTTDNGSFPGGKLPGSGVKHLLPSSVGLKEKSYTSAPPLGLLQVTG